MMLGVDAAKAALVVVGELVLDGQGPSTGILGAELLELKTLGRFQDAGREQNFVQLGRVN